MKQKWTGFVTTDICPECKMLKIDCVCENHIGGDKMSDKSWKEGIDDAAVDRSLQAGEILPKLDLPKIAKGDTASKENLVVKLLDNPYKVENERFIKGYAYFAVVEHNNMKMSILVPDSLRFSMAKECKQHNIEEPKGHVFVIGAQLADLKVKKDEKGNIIRPALKDKTMYYCQIKDIKTEPEAVE